MKFSLPVDTRSGVGPLRTLARWASVLRKQDFVTINRADQGPEDKDVVGWFGAAKGYLNLSRLEAGIPGIEEDNEFTGDNRFTGDNVFTGENTFEDDIFANGSIVLENNAFLRGESTTGDEHNLAGINASNYAYYGPPGTSGLEDTVIRSANGKNVVIAPSGTHPSGTWLFDDVSPEYALLPRVTNTYELGSEALQINRAWINEVRSNLDISINTKDSSDNISFKLGGTEISRVEGGHFYVENKLILDNNNTGVLMGRVTGGTAIDIMKVDYNNDVRVGNSGSGNRLLVYSANEMQFYTSGACRWKMGDTSGTWFPNTTNTYNLGGPSNRVKTGYFVATDVSSDERIKENIDSLSPSEALSIVEGLNPVRFDYKNSEAQPGRRSGFIAQEMIDSIPEAVSKGDDFDVWGIRNENIIPFLAGAIQELNKKVCILEELIK